MLVSSGKCSLLRYLFPRVIFHTLHNSQKISKNILRAYLSLQLHYDQLNSPCTLYIFLLHTCENIINDMSVKCRTTQYGKKTGSPGDEAFWKVATGWGGPPVIKIANADRPLYYVLREQALVGMYWDLTWNTAGLQAGRSKKWLMQGFAWTSSLPEPKWGEPVPWLPHTQ